MFPISEHPGWLVSTLVHWKSSKPELLSDHECRLDLVHLHETFSILQDLIAGGRERRRSDGWMLVQDGGAELFSRQAEERRAVVALAHCGSAAETQDPPPKQRITPRCVCAYQQAALFITGCVTCFGPFTLLGPDLLNFHQPITVKLLARALTNPATVYRRQQSPRTIANCRPEQKCWGGGLKPY